MADKPETFVLTLEAVRSAIPAAIRMRKLLKALRFYGFRCTFIIEPPAAAPAQMIPAATETTEPPAEPKPARKRGKKAVETVNQNL